MKILIIGTSSLLGSRLISSLTSEASLNIVSIRLRDYINDLKFNSELFPLLESADIVFNLSAPNASQIRDNPHISTIFYHHFPSLFLQYSTICQFSFYQVSSYHSVMPILSSSSTASPFDYNPTDSYASAHNKLERLFYDSFDDNKHAFIFRISNCFGPPPFSYSFSPHHWKNISNNLAYSYYSNIPVSIDSPSLLRPFLPISLFTDYCFSFFNKIQPKKHISQLISPYMLSLHNMNSLHQLINSSFSEQPTQSSLEHLKLNLTDYLADNLSSSPYFTDLFVDKQSFSIAFAEELITTYSYLSKYL